MGHERDALKALLIYPPKEHLVTSGLPKLVEEELGYYPPLGLLHIATCVRQQSDHQVTVLDAQAEELTYEQVQERVRQVAPDVVGVTAMTFTLYDAWRTAQVVKGVNEDIHVTLGGPHVSIYPAETAGLDGVDSVIVGEAELTFPRFLNALAEGRDLSEAPGVFFRRNGQIARSDARPIVRDLDMLPAPDRRLIRVERYSSLVDTDSFSTTMLTSRGCPNRCIFCANPHRTFRTRSADAVVAEMEDCLELGISEIYVFDDTFNLRRDRVLAICDRIIERQLPVRWAFRGRVHPLDAEMLSRLKRAGCSRIQLGVEAGTQDVLDRLRKGITLDQVRRAFALCRDAGVTTVAYFMIGSPGETRDHVLRTTDFAREIKPDYPVFCVTIPFPNTEMYREGLERGILSHDYWLEHARSPRKEMRPELWTEFLSPEEIHELFETAYRRFYFRPAYLLASLGKTRSLGELKRKAAGGLRMLRDVF